MIHIYVSIQLVKNVNVLNKNTSITLQQEIVILIVLKLLIALDLMQVILKLKLVCAKTIWNLILKIMNVSVKRDIH